jgi:hypothetical protein
VRVPELDRQLRLRDRLIDSEMGKRTVDGLREFASQDADMYSPSGKEVEGFDKLTWPRDCGFGEGRAHVPKRSFTVELTVSPRRAEPESLYLSHGTATLPSRARSVPGQQKIVNDGDLG